MASGNGCSMRQWLLNAPEVGAVCLSGALQLLHRPYTFAEAAFNCPEPPLTRRARDARVCDSDSARWPAAAASRSVRAFCRERSSWMSLALGGCALSDTSCLHIQSRVQGEGRSTSAAGLQTHGGGGWASASATGSWQCAPAHPCFHQWALLNMLPCHV